MKKANLLLSLVSLLVVFGLTACFGTPAQPTIDYQALINTSVAQTEVAEGPSGEVVPPSTAPTATATLLPTNTAIPTFTPIPTLVATPIPCYAMAFIKDITIPDGTDMSENTAFTKTWRVQNAGTCTWTTSFNLHFVGGTQMDADSNTPLSKKVVPGGLIDISVDMKSPSSTGTFTGNFKMKAADGTLFGAGPASVPIFVKIDVTGPLFAVTKVSNWTVTPNCGYPEVVFTTDIKTSTAGQVDYHWIFDNNGTHIKGPSGHVTFSKSQTIQVTVTWDLTGLGFTGPGSASIYIDSPNHQLFGPSGTFNCP